MSTLTVKLRKRILADAHADDWTIYVKAGELIVSPSSILVASLQSILVEEGYNFSARYELLDGRVIVTAAAHREGEVISSALGEALLFQRIVDRRTGAVTTEPDPAAFRKAETKARKRLIMLLLSHLIEPVRRRVAEAVRGYVSPDGILPEGQARLAQLFRSWEKAVNSDAYAETE